MSEVSSIQNHEPPPTPSSAMHTDVDSALDALRNVLVTYEHRPMPVQVRRRILRQMNEPPLRSVDRRTNAVLQDMTKRIAYGHTVGVDLVSMKLAPGSDQETQGRSKVLPEVAQMHSKPPRRPSERFPAAVDDALLLNAVQGGELFECRVLRSVSALRSSTTYRLVGLRRLVPSGPREVPPTSPNDAHVSEEVFPYTEDTVPTDPPPSNARLPRLPTEAWDESFVLRAPYSNEMPVPGQGRMQEGTMVTAASAATLTGHTAPSHNAISTPGGSREAIPRTQSAPVIVSAEEDKGTHLPQLSMLTAKVSNTKLSGISCVMYKEDNTPKASSVR